MWVLSFHWTLREVQAAREKVGFVSAVAHVCHVEGVRKEKLSPAEKAVQWWSG